jgi:hypothetical protein
MNQIDRQQMNTSYIRLRKIRDFGATISDTIQYLKIHWQNLLLLYAVFVVPFLLVATLMGANTFAAFFARIADTEELGRNPFAFFTPAFLLAIILYFLSTISYSTVVYLYMRQTEERGGQAPTLQETGAQFLPKLLSNSGYMLLAFLGLVGLALFAVIPILGILIAFLAFMYFMVDLALLFPANTIEDNPFPSAFRRMVHLVRDRWWYTFGVIIVFGMIFYFFSSIISLVSGMIFGISSVNFLKPANPEQVFTQKYFLVMGLSAVVQQVFYLIVHVGVGVHYFSLREEKDGAGLEEQIDQLGRDSGPHGHIDEQY